MRRPPSLGLLLALMAAPAAAQLATDPIAAARLDRTVRAVEARRVTQPGLAARDARDASNALARTPGGASGQALRTGSRLDDAAMSPQRGAAGVLVPLLPQPADSLPASTVTPSLGLGADPLAVVDQLIGRARAATAEGRPVDADADLEFAERQLARLTAAPAAAVAERRAAIGALRTSLAPPATR